MPLTYDQLREEVLSLPTDQQLELADTVYCASEPDTAPAGLHPAWSDELKRRSEDVRSGRAKGIPWEEVQLELDRIVEGR